MMKHAVTCGGPTRLEDQRTKNSPRLNLYSLHWVTVYGSRQISDCGDHAEIQCHTVHTYPLIAIVAPE